MNQRWGSHMVQVNFQCEEYKAEGIMEMGGNTKGVSILSGVLDYFEDGDFQPDMQYQANQDHFIVDEGGYLEAVRLRNSNGDELTISVDSDIDDWVTGATIIEFTPEVR